MTERNQDHELHALLLLPDADGLKVGRFLADAREALAAAGGRPVLCDTHRAVADARHVMCARIEVDHLGMGPAVLLTARALDPAAWPEDTARLLADATLRALSHCAADFLRWSDDGLLLERDEFIALRSYVSPRRKLPALEATLPALFHEDVEFPRHDPGELRMIAAGWAMTGLIACAAPPVGAGLVVYNAVRGANARLCCHMVALTGLGIALHDQGAFQRIATLAT